MTERTNTKVSLYYSRKSPRGKLTIVRNTRRPSMMDSLTTPYAQGIYTGAAGVGLITGMAMMGRRKDYEAAIAGLAKHSGEFGAVPDLDEFGWPCGNSFTSDRHKCHTDPKTGARLKKPITRQVYDKIVKSGGKAAQTLYKDREDRVRSSRRDGAKGWKRDDPIVDNPDYQRKKKAVTRNMAPSQYPFNFKNVAEIDASTDEIKSQLAGYIQERKDDILLREKTQALRLDREKKEWRLRLGIERIAFNDLRIERHKALLEKRAIESKSISSEPTLKKVTPKLTLDKVEASADREKLAAKSTRKARVNKSIPKSKQAQGTLSDDSPLMRSLGGEGNFGYACGSTFIPDSAKCYTDPKTRARLKTPLTKSQIRKVRDRSVGAEKLYAAQEAENKGRLRGGTIPPEYQAAARSTGATKVLPSGIAEVDPKKLNLDPKRFQYKIVSGATGESGSLSDVKKWDSNIAGVQLAWHDPADNKTYVINGHNRTNLAKKLGVESVTTRFIKADNAKQARSIGALTNISEGSGNSLDAAKFFRDSNLTQDDLTKKGIPLKSAVASEGIALSKLNDSLFDKVVQGDLSKERGTIIGRNLANHKEQTELVDLIDKQEKKGKKITNEGISELTDMIKSAPKQQAEGGFLSMLGFNPEARSLAVEKAEIQAHIKRQLSTDKKIFGVVGRNKNAAKLEREGNKIDTEKSRSISLRAERALATFDREKKYSGKVADEINLAATRIANGEKPNKVKDEVYQNVLKLIN
jgi:hypothetical protein